MANVFTKRSKIPRTTTLGDFGYKSQALRHFNSTRAKGQEPEITRLLSPTRRQNPQPIGLVYQSPYNRYNNVFGIWNPNQMMPVMRCKQTLPHLRHTNFSCSHEPETLERYMAPADPVAPVQRKEPQVQYRRWTNQRKSYKWPPEIPEKFRGMVKHTRFGHTPYNDGPAVGIVPNVLNRTPSAKRVSKWSDTCGIAPEVPGPSGIPISVQRTPVPPHKPHRISDRENWARESACVSACS